MTQDVMRPAVLVLASLLQPDSISACPYCDSEIGRQVSAGIFNGEFWQNELMTLLPIPVMLLIVGLIHFGMPWPRRTAPSVKRDE